MDILCTVILLPWWNCLRQLIIIVCLYYVLKTNGSKKIHKQNWKQYYEPADLLCSSYNNNIPFGCTFFNSQSWILPLVDALILLLLFYIIRKHIIDIILFIIPRVLFIIIIIIVMPPQRVLNIYQAQYQTKCFNSGTNKHALSFITPRV